MGLGQLDQHVATLRAAHLVLEGGTRRSDTIELYHDRIRAAVAAIAGASFRGRRGDATDRGVVLCVADQIVEPCQ